MATVGLKLSKCAAKSMRSHGGHWAQRGGGGVPWRPREPRLRLDLVLSLLGLLMLVTPALAQTCAYSYREKEYACSDGGLDNDVWDDIVPLNQHVFGV